MRLPESMTGLHPVGELLEAVEQGEDLLRRGVEEKQQRWLLSRADDEGLSRWEADFGLPDWTGVDAQRRRARLLPLLRCYGTLTPEQLAALAVSMDGVLDAQVIENFQDWQVELMLKCGGLLPDDWLRTLQKTVERFQPAHLRVDISPGLLLPNRRVLALSGGMMMELWGRCEAETECA